MIRDNFKRGKYRDVILPLTALLRMDQVLESVMEEVLKKRKKHISCPVCGARRVPGLMPQHMASAHPDHSAEKEFYAANSTKRNNPRRASAKARSDNGPRSTRLKKSLAGVPPSERKRVSTKRAMQPLAALKIPLSAKLTAAQRNEILGSALKVYARHKHRGHEKALNAGQKYVDRRVREVTKGKVNIQYSLPAARKTPFKPIKGALGNPRKHQP